MKYLLLIGITLVALSTDVSAQQTRQRDTVAVARNRLDSARQTEATAKSRSRGQADQEIQDRMAARLQKARMAEDMTILSRKLGQMSNRGGDSVSAAALRKAVETLRTSQMRELYADRLMTRRQLDESIGRARADSVIGAVLDTARIRRASDELQRAVQAVQANARRMETQQRRMQDTIHAQLVVELNRMAKVLDTLKASRARAPLPAFSLGMGLTCMGCVSQRNSAGAVVWTFREPPIVGAVEAGSFAERLGLRRGDTLRTIDDVSLTAQQGGEMLGAIAPGQTVKIGWSRGRVQQSASITIPGNASRRDSSARRFTQTVGNTRVEVTGNGASWTRDPRTGALRITGDSITVTVIPPAAPAVRDTPRRSSGGR